MHRANKRSTLTMSVRTSWLLQFRFICKAKIIALPFSFYCQTANVNTNFDINHLRFARITISEWYAFLETVQMHIKYFEQSCCKLFIHCSKFVLDRVGNSTKRSCKNSFVKFAEFLNKSDSYISLNCRILYWLNDYFHLHMSCLINSGF